MDLNDPTEVRVLLKKLWCHGQAVAPVQGLAYAVWAVTKSADLSTGFIILLWVAALKFPFWGWVSWRALHLKYGESSFKVLASFGLVIILMDIVIAVLAAVSGELSEGWPLLAFIATCLHAVETTAFLSAVTCFRSSLKSYDLVTAADSSLEAYEISL